MRLPEDTNDEFGDLTVAFSEMSHTLAVKQLLNEQRAENDRLLMSLMPESVVERYRDGEENHRRGASGRHGDLRRSDRRRRIVRRP